MHLPPPFTLRRTSRRDVLAEAVRRAPDEGAGTLVLHQSQGLLAFAVVLEPDRPLAEARRAFVVGMAALTDALAAHCPPERPVRIAFPGEVRFDRARLGGGRLAVAPGAGEDDVPDHMAFAAELIADRDHVEEPGLYPGSTSLKEEGFGPAEEIVATFASYLMLHFDRWTHQGFETVAAAFLKRIDPPLEGGERILEGDRLVAIAPDGGRRVVASLREALAADGWRDDGGPRL